MYPGKHAPQKSANLRLIVIFKELVVASVKSPSIEDVFIIPNPQSYGKDPFVKIVLISVEVVGL